MVNPEDPRATPGGQQAKTRFGGVGGSAAEEARRPRRSALRFPGYEPPAYLRLIAACRAAMIRTRSSGATLVVSAGRY